MSLRRNRVAGAIVFCVISVLAGYVGLATTAQAAAPPGATYTVNTTADGPDANPGDHVCDTGTGEGPLCTLRAAIQESNADDGAQTVAVPGGKYTLTTAAATASQPDTEDANDQNSDLDVTDDLTLTCFNDSEGPVGVCNVDGNQQGRVFDVHNAIIVTFDTTIGQDGPDASWEIQNGLPQGRDGTNGGGIRVGDEDATLNLHNTLVGGAEGSGGNHTGSTQTNGGESGGCDPNANTACNYQAGDGGGLYVGGNDDTVNLDNATFAENSSGGTDQQDPNCGTFYTCNFNGGDGGGVALGGVDDAVRTSANGAVFDSNTTLGSGCLPPGCEPPGSTPASPTPSPCPNGCASNTYAAGNGGGLAALGDASVLDMTNSLFGSNNAQDGQTPYRANSNAGHLHKHRRHRRHHKRRPTLLESKSGGYGGALYNQGDRADWSFTDSRIGVNGEDIHGNTADDGGGIWNFGSHADVTLDNTDMQNNFASDDGGAVGNGGRDLAFEVSDGSLIGGLENGDGNTAGGEGGGFYNGFAADRFALQFDNSTLQGNSATNGGGVYNDSPFMDLSFVNGSALDDNSALSEGGGDGGGIYNSGSDGAILFRDSDARRNSATDQGGATYNDGADLSLKLNNAHWDNNSSSNEGGALYNNGDDLTAEMVNVSSMDQNSAGGTGGAIYNSSSAQGFSLKTTESSLSHNQSSGSGGALGNDSYKADLTFEDSTLSFNTDDGTYGGALFINSGGGTLVSIDGSTLAGNSETGNDGGAIYFDGGKLTIDSSVFGGSAESDGNAAEGYGGAIYMDAGDLRATQTLFQNNATVDNEGGAIYNSDNTVTLVDSTLRDNQALDDGGGAIYNDGDEMKLVGTLVQHNKAYLDGGGIYQENSLLILDGSQVKDNQAGRTAGNIVDSDGSGGGIYGNDEVQILNGSVVSGNRATVSGGGVYADDLTKIADSTIDDNHALVDGGGIVGAYRLTVTNTTVSNNTTGGNGGGLWQQGGLALAVRNSTFNGNQAGVDLSGNDNSTSDGGAVYLSSDTRCFQDPFGGCFATVTGGDPALIHNSTITDNSASDQGGGIYTATERLGIKNVTIDANSAALHGGGGIARQDPNENANSVVVKNSIIANNTGDNCDNPIRTAGHNLSDDSKENNTCGLNPHFYNDILGADPMLGPLADNGGPTKTQALMPGSPAIDSGDTDGCPTGDQRDFTRPSGSGCDIGAYEVQGGQTSTPSPDFTVNSTADYPDSKKGDGICAADVPSIDQEVAVCTLRAAVQEANHDPGAQTVFLPAQQVEGQPTGTVYQVWGNPQQLNLGSIKIVHDLDIVGDGSDTVYVDARCHEAFSCPPHRVFSILEHASVQMSGITIRNGSSQSPCNTEGCINPPDPKLGFGGGVLLYGPVVNLRLHDVRLRHNAAAKRGGAVFMHGRDQDLRVLDGSRIASNRAHKGGGVAVRGIDDNVEFTDSKVAHNRATGGYGGGANVSGSNNDVQVKDSTFRANVAANGGGISNGGHNNSYTIDNSTFEGNRGHGEGGALYLSNDSVKVDITNGSEFTSNRARGGGGAIEDYCCASNVTIADSLFADNATLGGGGAVEVQETEEEGWTITGSTFYGNRAGFESPGQGGAVKFNGGLLDISDSVFGCFTQEQADHAPEGAPMCGAEDISGNATSGNSTSGNGGAIFSTGRNVEMTKVSIVNNAASDGGGFASDDYTAHIDGSYLSGNYAFGGGPQDGGGGVYHIGEGMTISNTDITGNQAVSNGGGLYQANDLVRLTDSNVNDNQASGDGGGIYAPYATNLLRTKIDNNDAGSEAGRGGGMWAGDTGLIQDSTFSNNDAVQGGGLYNTSESPGNNGGPLTVDGSTFNDNAAAGMGGGINNNKDLKLTNSTLANNDAGYNGGAIFNNVTEVSARSDTFSGNAAGTNPNSEGGDGSVLYENSPMTFYAKNSIFANSAGGSLCAGVADSGEAGPVTSAGGNLSDEPANEDSCGLQSRQDQLGMDPMLQPLGNYGGPTKTMPPMAGSPAIDRALNNGCPDIDQQLKARPLGVACDIGAVEGPYSPQQTSTPPPQGGGGGGGGQPTPTPTPSASPSASPSPSASATPTPSPSGSQSGTPTPSPTPSGHNQEFDTGVTLGFTPKGGHAPAVGTRAPTVQGVFHGKVKSKLPACVRGRRIRLLRVRHGHKKFVGRTFSKHSGRFKFNARHRVHGTFYARAKRKVIQKSADTTITCRAANSPKIHISRKIYS